MANTNGVPWFWKWLTSDERRHLRAVLRLSPDVRPRAAKPRALEGRAELGRIMKAPPGRIGQLKEELIQRVEPEEAE